jgi:hypothetical protein
MSAADERLRALFDAEGCKVKPGVNAFMTPQVEEHVASEADASQSI